MKTRLELVETWRRSVSVMHIAHHIAASRYAKWHRWLGGTAAVLAAVVCTSIFATLANDLQYVSKVAVIAVALVSMLSASLSAAATFLNLDERARRHLEAAADFQRLRREMDEELVRCKDTEKGTDLFCVQPRLARSAGDSPAGGGTRGLALGHGNGDRFIFRTQAKCIK